MIPAVAGLTADTGVLAAVVAAGCALAGIYFQRQIQHRKDAKTAEEAPAREMNAMGQTAEVIARAAASLIAPFQQTIADMQRELGALREALNLSRAAEAKCQAELGEVRSKLREVTDHLGLEPDCPTSES